MQVSLRTGCSSLSTCTKTAQTTYWLLFQFQHPQGILHKFRMWGLLKIKEWNYRSMLCQSKTRNSGGILISISQIIRIRLKVWARSKIFTSLTLAGDSPTRQQIISYELAIRLVQCGDLLRMVFIQLTSLITMQPQVFIL